MTNDTDKTIVIFRVWKSGSGKGDVIALFPADTWHDGTRKLCQSFEHVGQHGGADYAHVIRATRPATPAEYADVKRELETLYGYNLDVRKRWTK